MVSTGPLAVVKGLVELEEDLGEFIAGPPAPGLKGHVREQYQKRCDQFANLPPWAKSIADGGGGPLGRICQPYWDQGGYDGPVRDTPFVGGQCPVDYYIIYGYQPINTDGTFGAEVQQPSITMPGPLSGIATEGGPGASNLVVTAKDGVKYTLRSSSAPQGDFANPRIIQAVRLDGQPDNCGNPPTTIKPGPNPPPNPGPSPGPEPTSDPSNPTGMPLLPIPPYEDPIGGPTPIVGPDPTEPTLGPSPSGGNPDSLPGGPENVGQPIEVDPAGSGGGGGTDFGPPPPGRVWVGCLLRFTIPPEVGSIPGSGPANRIVAAVFGNASLIVTGGLDTPERINGANMMLVRKSAAVNVNGVYVNLKPGFTYTVKPLSLEKCPDPICGDA